MKIINQYKFKNDKEITIYHLTNADRKKHKIPYVDNLMLDWTHGDGVHIRPDEALIIAKMLIDAVYKVTGGYKEKLLKGYYGYKEHKL